MAGRYRTAKGKDHSLSEVVNGGCPVEKMLQHTLEETFKRRTTRTSVEPDQKLVTSSLVGRWEEPVEKLASLVLGF